MKNFYETASKRLISYGVANSINFTLVTAIALYFDRMYIITILAMVLSFSVAVFDFIQAARYKKCAKAEEANFHNGKGN